MSAIVMVVVRYDDGSGVPQEVTGTVKSNTPQGVVLSNPCEQNGSPLHTSLGDEIDIPRHRIYRILTPSSSPK